MKLQKGKPEILHLTTPWVKLKRQRMPKSANKANKDRNTAKFKCAPQRPPKWALWSARAEGKTVMDRGGALAKRVRGIYAPPPQSPQQT